jgi:hypothetical protein
MNHHIPLYNVSNHHDSHTYLCIYIYPILTTYSNFFLLFFFCFPFIFFIFLYFYFLFFQSLSISVSFQSKLTNMHLHEESTQPRQFFSFRVSCDSRWFILQIHVSNDTVTVTSIHTQTHTWQCRSTAFLEYKKESVWGKHKNKQKRSNKTKVESHKRQVIRKRIKRRARERAKKQQTNKQNRLNFYNISKHTCTFCTRNLQTSLFLF